MKYIEVSQPEEATEEKGPKEGEEKPERRCGEAKRQRTEDPTRSQKLSTPPRRPTTFSEVFWTSKPPSWPPKQPQEAAGGDLKDKGEKGNLFFLTCETIKVAAHPPIIRDAAMPAKCPTTVPTNTKIEL